MNPLDRARAAATSAIAIQIVGLVGLTLDGVYWATSHGHLPPGYPPALAILAALLAALLARRARPSAGLAVTAVLVNLAAVLIALWTADEVLAREPHAWVPFQPHKLGVLTLALIAPAPTWLGLISIAAFTAAPVAHYLAFPPDVRANLALGEPWGTLAFGAFALAIFVHRRRLSDLERKAARMQAEAESLERLARLMLAVRDLSNTPIQTLRISAATLRRRHPEEEARLDRMDHALDRLEQLERSLSKHQGSIRWTRASESFDPIAVLEGAGASEPSHAMRR